jgi:thiamine pyrophosphokinase
MKLTTEPIDTAIVLLGGSRSDFTSIGPLPTPTLVVAADSGAHHAESLGLCVDVVIGDMDSIDPTALAAVQALGARVVSHPRDKNATDAELALTFAASQGVRRLVVVGSGGGRLDHQLSLFSLLFHQSLTDMHVEARIGGSRSFPIREGESRTIDCREGDIIGLLPFGGDAHGITTEGLQWPLRDESLFVTGSRGVSNRAMGSNFQVVVRTGRLLVTIDPHDHSGEEPTR